MRNYIRHPSDIPIEFMVENDSGGTPESLRDVSFGGLSFQSSEELASGSFVHIRIDTVHPPFEADGIVVWCQADGGLYTIGMEFTHKEDVFLARMVEQICHIEHYKKVVQESDGRKLTSQEAAIEWISKFAELFPNPENDQRSEPIKLKIMK